MRLHRRRFSCLRGRLEHDFDLRRRCLRTPSVGCSRPRLAFKPGSQACNIRATGGHAIQAATYGFRECGWKVRGEHQPFALRVAPGGRLSRQRLDQRHAQSPDIGCGGEYLSGHFRSVIHRGRADVGGRFTGWTDGVARHFELVTDHQDVGRLQLPLHELAAMQERQRVQRGKQHFASLAGRERTMSENLREILIGEFHDDEQEMALAELATPRVEQPDQARMRQDGGGTPMRELSLRETRYRRHQLERGLGDSFRRILGEKYPAVIRSAEAAQQRIGAIDDVPFPLGPDLAHRRPLTFARIAQHLTKRTSLTQAVSQF